MKLFPVAAVCAVLVLCTALKPAFADTASSEDLKAIRKSLDELRASQADLNKQIQEIKSQLHNTAAPAARASATSGTQQTKQNPVSFLNNISYDLDPDDRTTGPKDAKVVMLE